MLTSILKMPRAFGIPTDRVAVIITSPEHQSTSSAPVFHYPELTLARPTITIGSCVSQAPENLYKAVYIAYDQRSVIEAVFAAEQHATSCLYAKITSPTTTNYGISTRAISAYLGDYYGINLVPLSHYVFTHGPDDRDTTPVKLNPHFSDMNYIVPPVFGQQSVLNFLRRLVSIRSEITTSQSALPKPLPMLGNQYLILSTQTPSVLNALIHGRFDRSPFFDIPKPHPQIQFEQPMWYLYQKMQLSYAVGTHKVWVNHALFDGVALFALYMPETSFEIQTSLSSAVNGLQADMIVKDYDHPYYCLWMELHDHQSHHDRFLHIIVDLVYQAVRVFCRAHHFDLAALASFEHHRSTLTIAKTNTDEVAFTFYDSVHDVRMIYYTSAPALMLATQSVGWV